MFRCGKCPSTFNFKSSLVDHEKIHNEESKKIEIGPQMFVPNIPAGPSNSLLNDLSPRGNTTDTYMAATEEFENTNTIRVINDEENAEIESMALELDQKNQQQIIKCPEDIESIKGRFYWTVTEGYHFPCILRLINGELVQFSSIRMIDAYLMRSYINNLHPDVYTFCPSLTRFSITDKEANLLNIINYDYTENMYGNKMFIAGKDLIMQLEDINELYKFLEVCYRTLQSEQKNNNDKFGFIRIDFESVVPYINIDNQKFVPLIYFEGDTEQLLNTSITIDKFNLAYLKFCCLIQGTINEFVDSKSCTVANIDDIKKYFNPKTNFEDYWPTKQHYSHLLLSHKVPQAEHDENTVYQTLTTPTSMVPQSVPVNTNENKLSEIKEKPCFQQYHVQQEQQQIINTPPTRQSDLGNSVHSRSRHHRINIHQRNALRNSVVIDEVDLTSPPSSPGPKIDPLTSYHSNVGLEMTRKPEQMTKQDESSDNVNDEQWYQTQQIINTHPIQQSYQGKSGPIRNRRRRLNAHQIVPSTSHHSNFGLEMTRKPEEMTKQYETSNNANDEFQKWYQPLQQQQQTIDIPQIQQPDISNSVQRRSRRHRINIHQRNALRNSVVIDEVDLSSPPSSPGPKIEPLTSYHSNVGLEMTRKPEQMTKQDESSDNVNDEQWYQTQQQQQQIINTHPIQQSYQGKFGPIRNHRRRINAHQIAPSTSHHFNSGLEMTRKPEQMIKQYETSNNANDEFQQWCQIIEQQQQQKPQIINTPPTQQSYRGKYVRGRGSRSSINPQQQRYNLRNSTVLYDIDLSSPPSSPGPGGV